MNAKEMYRVLYSEIRRQQNTWSCDSRSDMWSYREWINSWELTNPVDKAVVNSFLNQGDELEDRQTSNTLLKACGDPTPFVRFWFGM